ncbi:hypothetical protein M3J09_002222 [Ascochyta lentis]
MFQRSPLPERREYAAHRCQGWYPPALRWWNLALFTFLSWGFIIVLQYFLHKSQTDGGVIFASDINRLPLRRSFVYLYMPTIIAVTFSIYVVWIDNDAKRFEPYRQLSQSAGARGKDSLLLHYTFDFIPAVPFAAAKRGHYLVFWASFATVLTTFGVVPLQAGIFTTQEVTRAFAEPFVLSNRFMHSSLQDADLDLSYAHSAYGILNLNETLPAFMTYDYTLAPFTATSSGYSGSGTWTANTTLYSMDLQCEDVETVTVAKMSELEDYTKPMTRFNDSTGCSCLLGNFNNATIGEVIDTETSMLYANNEDVRVRTFSSFFAGYVAGIRSSTEMIGYALSSAACNGTMLASFVRNRDRATDPPNNITAISCRPNYYEQDVEATVDAVTKSPLGVVYHGQKRALTEGLFNSSIFEETLYTGYRRSEHRGDGLMGRGIPRYLEMIDKLNVTQLQRWSTGWEFPPMAAMAITTSQRPIEGFLDSQVMKDAYGFAYKLLFVRAMVDILETDFATSTREVPGKRLERTEAVVLNLVFTYLVECLLAVISVSAIALLYISTVRSRNHKLRDDPGSLAALMSMVADSAALLANFEELDCCSHDYLKHKLRNEVYMFQSDDHQARIVEAPQSAEAHQRLLEKSRLSSEDELKTVHPTRPVEFRLYTAIPFTALFVVLMTLLAILFVKSRPQGLPLPSKNPVVQNLVVQYLPTATATLIEPMWILINRLLCVLQPLEELRGSKASAPKSLLLNYTSLPPQLTIIKAIRAGHITLASVCVMALLANLLATSFAGLFFQNSLSINHPTQFWPPYEAQFININGSVGPPADGRPIAASLRYSGAYQGGTGEEQFLVSVSNYTRNTTLPSWVDETAMYLPFKTANPTGQAVEDTYKARTKYFSAKSNCKPLKFSEDFLWRMWNVNQSSSDPTRARNKKPDSIFEVKVLDAAGVASTCYAPDNSAEDWGIALGRKSHPIGDDPCPSGKTSADLLTTLVAGRNASEHDWATCRSAVVVGWMRTMQGNCSARVGYNKIPKDFEEANSNNTFLMTCQPTISIGDADVHVDSDGVLQSKASNLIPDVDQSTEAVAKYFTNGPEGLIAQSNSFIFRGQYSGYHNDSFASEYFHLFVNRAAGNLRLTDPTAPLPTYEDVTKPVETAYVRLFAIWLGVNYDLLLVPANVTAKWVEGTVVREEERLFFTVPMFIISEIILGIYVIVSTLVYLRRPGRYLPRMPTSIAAVIALFASSAAVKDLQGTSHMTNKEREQYLKDLDCRYGYGSYVGSDGAVHVGIEKLPYVRYMKEVTFVGSRVEREMRRRREGKEDKQGPRVEYTALERQDEDDERPVSPLEAVSLNTDEGQPGSGQHGPRSKIT